MKRTDLIGASLMSVCVIASTLGCGNSAADPAPVIKDTSTTFDLAEVGRIINGKNDRFTAAHITGDSAVLINYFTTDARVLGPNAEPVIGSAAIARLNAEYLAFGVSEFTEETTRLYGNGEYVIDEGNYTMRYGKENALEVGKYLNVWKQVDGDWKVYANMWNTNR